MNTKPEYYYHQSAVLPYRLRGDSIEILLISSRKKRRWIVPKGICEADLSAAESAAKEALEEAGIEGTTGELPIGSYSYPKWEGLCTVDVFAMRVDTVHPRWPEGHRLRLWLTPSAAAERLAEPALKNLVLDFEPAARSDVEG